jgi:hypothetical protein
LRHLDARGWRDELSQLVHLLATPAAKKRWQKDWGGTFGDYDQYSAADLDYPIIDVIRHKKGGVTIPALALPALLVKLTAPDAVILREVKAALNQWRKRHPVSVSKPGRKAANAVFDQSTFGVWLDNKIAELGELLAWRNELPKSERTKFPNAALGSWLGFEDKKTSIAIGILNRALRDFRPINSQVVSEACAPPASKG